MTRSPQIHKQGQFLPSTHDIPAHSGHLKAPGEYLNLPGLLDPRNCSKICEFQYCKGSEMDHRIRFGQLQLRLVPNRAPSTRTQNPTKTGESKECRVSKCRLHLRIEEKKSTETPMNIDSQCQVFLSEWRVGFFEIGPLHWPGLIRGFLPQLMEKCMSESRPQYMFAVCTSIEFCLRDV